MKWYLAEIGIAMDIQSEGPVLADGVIDDTFRIELMEEHLEQLHRAISEGANCFGVQSSSWETVAAASNIRAAGAGYCHCYSVKEDHNGHRQDRTIVSKLTIDYI